MEAMSITPTPPTAQGSTLGQHAAFAAIGSAIGLMTLIVYESIKGWRERKQADALADLEAKLLLQRVHPAVMASVDRRIEEVLKQVDPNSVKIMAVEVEKKAAQAREAALSAVRELIPEAYAKGRAETVEELISKGFLKRPEPAPVS